MQLSVRGEKMSEKSGVRRILEDIATATAGPVGGAWLDLGAGNPARIPEVVRMWTELTRTAVDTDFAMLSTGRPAASRDSSARWPITSAGTTGDSFVVAESIAAEFAGHASRCIRLSLSADLPTIIEGITRIADALREVRSAARPARTAFAMRH